MTGDYDMEKTITARCWSDDRAVEVEFDAVKWFEQTDDEAILDLIKCEWAGDYGADAVAEFMENIDPAVERMFSYIVTYNEVHETQGFECAVDEPEARKWLTEHRPHILDTCSKCGQRFEVHNGDGSCVVDEEEKAL